jgi:hypothetical protein
LQSERCVVGFNHRLVRVSNGRKGPSPFNDLLPIGASIAPMQIGRDERQRIRKCFNPTSPVGGLSMGRTMIKGFVIAALALLGASQVDQYLTNGRYTDGAMAMLRQISHSFGI